MCDFCGPKCSSHDVDSYSETGFTPGKVAYSNLFGKKDGNGIRLLNRKVLQFDNSCGEYAAGMIDIKFCPFCGDKLE